MSSGSDEFLLSPRESVARALSIFTVTSEYVDSEHVDDFELKKQVLRLAGDDPRELLEVLVTMAALSLSIMETVSPSDPLAVVRVLGMGLDELDDDDETDGD